MAACDLHSHKCLKELAGKPLSNCTQATMHLHSAQEMSQGLAKPRRAPEDHTCSSTLVKFHRRRKGTSSMSSLLRTAHVSIIDGLTHGSPVCYAWYKILWLTDTAASHCACTKALV